MEIKRTILKPGAREKTSSRAYATAAVLAAGLAILPSCAMTRNKPAPVDPQPVQDVAEVTAKPVASDFCTSKNIPSSVRTVRQAGGGSILYRTDTRVVKRGDKVRMSDLAEGEFYGKVIMISDKRIALSFDNRIWSVNYNGPSSAGEFLLAITITAEKCSSKTVLLSVTYPVGQRQEASKK